MKKRTIVISRRQVLRGAGGFTLGLPFLPSLVPVKAWAAEPQLARQPAFVSMVNFNGGALDANTFPADAMLTDTAEPVSGYVIRRGRLARALEGDDAYVSPILRAPASELTERLVGKMNVLRGVDMPFNLGHSTSAPLGNYFNMVTGTDTKFTPWPTVDMFLAWSPTFYRNLAGVRKRSINTGSSWETLGVSYYYANPTTQTGPIQKVGREFDPVKLWNGLFSGGSGLPAAAPGRPPIVDRVIDTYRQMRNGSRRLSADDRRRLDDHMGRLAELQRQINAAQVRPAGCRDLRAPTPASDRVSRFKLEAEVVAAAFLCGYSRVATFMVPEESFSSRSWANGIWHNEITHGSSKPENQALIVESYRSMFRNLFLELARKLDVEEAPGVTCLDNTLMMWVQECSERTHDQTSIPVVMMGGAAGALRTGNYCDYRNRTERAMLPPGYMRRTYTGLTWNRLLGTVVQSMGVPRSEYEKPGAFGYGHQYRSGSYVGAQTPGTWEQSGEILPFLKA